MIRRQMMAEQMTYGRKRRRYCAVQITKDQDRRMMIRKIKSCINHTILKMWSQK